MEIFHSYCITLVLKSIIVQFIHGINIKQHFREGFTTNITVNYVDSYLNDQIEPNAPVDSWTTINLTLSYDTGDRFGGWMEGAVFSLSALNLFNQDPPFIEAGLQTNSRIFYDPNAANPRGRVLSSQITKQW